MSREQSAGGMRQPEPAWGRGWLRGAAAMLIAWAGAMSGIGVASAEAPAPVHVGSGACAACHADETAAWTGSHHDWALKPAEAPFVLGDFDDARFESKGTLARFLREGDRYIVELAEDGAEPVRHPVVYAVGVEPLQQYLVETEEGRLQALDLAFDTERGRWFELYPDQVLSASDGLHWTGPYKNWNARCADCHHTNFRKNYDPLSRRYASSWSEGKVGCEACHGPGSVHVAWAKAGGGAPGNDTDAPAASTGLSATGLTATGLTATGLTATGLTATGLTIGFSPDDPEAEIQRCAQCHSRREPLSGDSPVPGTPFADHYRLSRLDPDLYFPDGQDNEEVYIYGAFLQSRMYAKGVTCTDCHDPHRLELSASDNAVCTRCHSEAANPEFPSLRQAVYDDPSHHRHPAGSPGAQCVACHMPERTYMQIDGRRDHSFRVPRPDVSGPIGAPDTCTSCHTDKDYRWAAAAIAEWFPDGRHTAPHFGTLFAEASGDGARPDEVISRLIAYAKDPGQPGIVRASALDRIAPVSPPVLAGTLDLLSDPDPAVRSAAVGLRQGAPAEVRAAELAAVLDDPARSVRIDAARRMLGVPDDLIPASVRPALEKAMGEYQAALAATADTPETQMALGGVALVIRNPAAAIRAFDTATELDAGLAEAWRMAARVRWATGDPAAALDMVEKGLSANPDAPSLLGTKAGLQAAMGDPAGATTTYERALAADPAALPLRLEYGDHLAAGGNHTRALAILTPALADHPEHPELLWLVARSGAGAGDAALARDAIAAFRRSNPGHPLTAEVDRLAVTVP